MYIAFVSAGPAAVFPYFLDFAEYFFRYYGFMGTSCNYPFIFRQPSGLLALKTNFFTYPLDSVPDVNPAGQYPSDSNGTPS